MSIDWASVNWGYVALLSGYAFVAALVANYITFRHRLGAAILAAVRDHLCVRNLLSPRHSPAHRKIGSTRRA
jgi:hypothetical protein